MATQELKVAYRDPNIVEHLCHALCSSRNIQVRQYSAVLLRKKLYRFRSWKKLPLEMQNGLKSGLLQRIACEKEQPVILAIGQLVAVIAKHEYQRTRWAELEELLDRLMHSSNVAERALGFHLTSIISSVAPEVFSHHLRPLFKFFGECLQRCGDDEICFYVIKSMTALARFVGTDNSNYFQALIPFVMDVIQRLAGSDEDKAVEALELFDGLIYFDVAVLVPHMRPLIKLCLEIAGDSRKGDMLRVCAMSVLGWMVNVKKKAIVKHKLIPELLDVFLPIMEEVSPHDVDEMEEEDGQSCQSPSACAAQLIDTMALHLPPEKLLPPLFQHINKRVKSDSASQRRAAYLAIAMIAEGCSEAIREKYLPTFVQTICEGILDQDVQVRNAALFALGQFADYLQVTGTIGPPVERCIRRQAISTAEPYLRHGPWNVLPARNGDHPPETALAGRETVITTMTTISNNDPGCTGHNDQPMQDPTMVQTRMESNHVTTEVVVPNGHLVNNEDVATNAAKRHKTDEDISESTETCFDEDEDLPEADPFITVNYKKQQRQGIPVVFAPRCLKARGTAALQEVPSVGVLTSDNVGQMLVPMLFAVLKAIIKMTPRSTSLAEVKVLLAMEPLIGPNNMAFTSAAELMALLQKDPPSLSKTFYALETFCENLEEKLVPHLPSVMQKVFLFLTAPSYLAKKLAISAIGSAANATKEAMLPYFPQIMSELKQYLTEHQTEQNATLRTQAIDTLGCLARTIGASNFLPMASECVELGLHLIDAVDDPDLRKSTYGMFASVSSVLKADMKKYLEPILDHMFTSLQSTEGVVTQFADTSGLNFQLFDDLEEGDDEAAEIDTDCAEDASDDDSDDDNEQSCTIANAYLEEKEDTCGLLAEMADNIGPAFAPYLEKCVTEVYHMADYPARDVQKAALSCLGQLIVMLFKSAGQAGDGDHANIGDASKAASMLISKLVEVSHIEREREVVLAALETLGLLINELKSVAFEGEEQLKLVVDLVKSAFNSKLKAQCADEEIDEADEQDEAEYDGLLVQMAGDLVPAMAKALPAERFAPYMAGLLPFFMGKLKRHSSTSDRSYAVGTLAEVAASMGEEGIGPFCRPLQQIFLNGMRDPNGEVRSNAVYGLGVLIKNAREILQPEYPALLEALSTMLAREDNRHAKDNICGAVAKLLLVGVTVVPVEQIFPVLLQQLPLQEDFEENDSVFHCICYLCGIGHEVVMKNLPAILRIILKVIQTDQITIETRVNLLHLVKSLSLSYPQEIQAILQECSLEEQQVFQAVWKNS
ncbi:hypothetical protein MRX96_015838 [Rhipicephalus microplus]